MTAQTKRWRRRELQAARALGTTRTKHRGRFEKAPDAKCFTHPTGAIVQPEVKTRKRLPKLLTDALAQAKDYGPKGCVPLAVLSATGGRPIACLPLDDFTRLAGIEPKQVDTAQLSLATADAPALPAPDADDTRNRARVARFWRMLVTRDYTPPDPYDDLAAEIREARLFYDYIREIGLEGDCGELLRRFVLDANELLEGRAA